MNRHSKEEVAKAEGRMRARLLFRALDGWDEKTWTDFLTLPFDSIEAELEIYYNAVKNGRGKLEGLYDGDKRIGTVLYLMDTETLYVVALAGRGPDEGLCYSEIMEAGERRAKELGCKFLRADADRPGALRYLLNAGYVPARVALIKELLD